MTTNNTPTFSSVYPFDVKLENKSFGQDTSLLYITSKVNETSAFQKVKIIIDQIATGQYTFNQFDFTPPASVTQYTPGTSITTPTLAPANNTFKPDAQQYNFGIVIKQGVLEEQVLLSFTNTLYEAIQKSLPAGNNCVVQGPFIDSYDHSLRWYCAFSKNMVSQRNQVIWKKVANGSAPDMVNITQMTDGQLFGVGTDTNFYSCDLKQGTAWSNMHTNNWQAFSGVVLPNGQLRLIGLDHNLYNGGNALNSEFSLIAKGYNIKFIAALPDNSLLGINTAGNLLHLELNSTVWTTIDKTIALNTAVLGDDNIIYGADTNGHYYQRKGITGQWQQITAIPEILEHQTINGTEEYAVNITNSCLVENVIKSAPVALSFELDGVSAAPETGSRNTQIEFLFGNVSLGSNKEKFEFKRSVSVDIINHQGNSYAPLHFGVVGENSLLNDGAAQDLTLYFQTNQNSPVTFNNETKITFNFPYQQESDGLVGFGDTSVVNAYSFSPSSDAYFSAESDSDGIIVVKGNTTKALTVEIFKFSNIVLGGQDGLAIIEVTVNNLPGYWDSTFQIAINKTSSNAGTQTGPLELPSSNNNGRSGSNGSRIDFSTEGKDENKHYNISIEAYNGLNLYGTAPSKTESGARGVPSSATEQKEGLPVRIKETDLIIPEGRLAINGGPNYPTPETGDSNKNEKLNVNGDSYLDGHLGVSKDLGVGGEATIKTDLTVHGDASIDGELTVSGDTTLDRTLKVSGGTTIEGDTASINTQIELGGASKKGNYGNGSRIDFLSSGKASNGIANISIEEYYGLNLHGTSSQPVAVRNTDLKVKEGRVQDKTGDIMPVGSVISYAGKTAPSGWLMCDGKAIPTGDQYNELKTVLGTSNTPNLSGRMVLGANTNYVMNSDGSQPNLGNLGSLSVGEMKGDTQHLLTESEMPSHHHQSQWANPGNSMTGFAGIIGNLRAGINSGATGGDQPHNNMPPYTALNYIIKY